LRFYVHVERIAHGHILAEIAVLLLRFMRREQV